MSAATLLVAVVVLAVGIWFLIRDGRPEPDREPTPAFSFDLGAVRGLGVTGKSAKSQLRQPAALIRTTLDALYTAGFVDPQKWEGGRFGEVLAAFAGPAEQRARRDLADLTLGPAVAAIESVRPEPGELTLRFLLNDREAVAVVARTSFDATAILRDGGTLQISHKGRYLLRRSGDRWVIVGYDVDGRLAPAAKRGASDGKGGG